MEQCFVGISKLWKNNIILFLKFTALLTALLREILPIWILWRCLIYIYTTAFKKKKRFKEQKAVILTKNISVEMISTVGYEFLFLG